jgi:GrpB-like predicted nucleotidyltransferase (UPF0157 family)
VLLVPYDPLWPLEYAAEADRIAHACDDLPFRLEHIGSTAVPGLGARPVIDIAMGIPGNAKRHEYFAALRQLGYEHRGTDGVPGRDYFVRGSPRSHHVHLVSWSSSLWNDWLLFRDHLRGNPGAAREYDGLKRELSATFADEPREYADAKGAFVRAAVRRAREDG